MPPTCVASDPERDVDEDRELEVTSFRANASETPIAAVAAALTR